MGADSNQHQELLDLADSLDRTHGYADIGAGNAIRGLIEQLETKERLLDLASEMGHSLEEQLEVLRKALEAISSLPDQSEVWNRCDVAVQIADRALADVSNPASSPRAGELLWFPLEEGQEPPVGWSKHPDGKHAWRIADGAEPSPATESVLERKAREQRESPRGAPPSVLPDPDIDLSSPASSPVGVVKDGTLHWTDEHGVEHSGPFQEGRP